MTSVDRIVSRLRTIEPGSLPAAARSIFAERIARRLRVAPDARIPAPALESMRAWPAPRLLELEISLDAIASEIERDRNERWNDEVRTHVARTYL